jgi:hypothetical protein
VPRATIEQTYFAAARPFAAPGGRVVFPGAVVVAQPAGEEDSELRNPAVAVVSSRLALDRHFGAQRRRPALGIQLPRRQRAAAVRLRMRTSSPWLAAISVRAGGRLVARATVPIWKSGHSSVTIPRAPSRRTGHLRATVRFRDLVGATARATS